MTWGPTPLPPQSPLPISHEHSFPTHTKFLNCQLSYAKSRKQILNFLARCITSRGGYKKNNDIAAVCLLSPSEAVKTMRPPTYLNEVPRRYRRQREETRKSRGKSPWIREDHLSYSLSHLWPRTCITDASRSVVSDNRIDLQPCMSEIINIEYWY